MTPRDMIIIAALCGAAFGVVYLGLLWVSVRLLPRRRGAVVFIALGIARAVLVAGALALALLFKTPLMTIAAAVSGFLVVRFAMTRATDPANGFQPWT